MTSSARRPPAPRASFRTAGRAATRRRDRPPPPAAAQIVLWAVLGLGVLFIASRATGIVADGAGSVAGAVVRAMPVAPSPTSLVLPAAAPGAVSAQPIFDQLPTFTAVPKLVVYGHVPAFAIELGRRIELSLNDRSLGMFAFDAAGRFGTEVTLRDGANTVNAKLLAGNDLVAMTSATIVLDRAAPSLTITRPRAGDTIDGAEVQVEGKTAPRASVQVNGRVVSANPDGTFIDRLPLAAGPQTIVISARNEAGVEAKVTIPVTVKPSATTVPAAQLGVALDRVRVRPGDPVNAQVIFTDGGTARGGVTVSVSVGVVSVGTARTDATGRAVIPFAAPTTEGEIAVVALASGASARATLTVTKDATPPPARR
ncbi:MAG: hypothetical protein EXR61_05340 [Chloroflexi bacterium]|nr:hypothetical protein [Chloroflexota bacterium]